jgi:hypothetical protein
MSGDRSLAQHSQTDLPSPERILEGQLRECYGRVVYSHKTHEKCADILLGRHSLVKGSQLVLSAMTTAGFISTFFGSGQIGIALGVIVSTALLILNAYTKDYDLGELAQKHKQAAAEIWPLRERYLSLLSDLAAGARAPGGIRGERDELMKALHAVYAGSPSTTYRAYRQAQEALQRKEDMTFSDAEIDAFLPRELKRSIPSSPHE